MEKIIEVLIKVIVDNFGITISGISTLLAASGVYLFNVLYRWHQNSCVAKDLVEYQFNYQNVKSKRDFFIDTQAQNITPSVEDEAETGAAFIVKKKLIPFFINTAFKKKEKNKFYLVLADSGMGKTTFMINLYLRYSSFFRFGKKYKIKLLPFGYKGIIEKIEEIKKNEDVTQTILLLDAFDEYKKLLPIEELDELSDEDRFRKVLDEVIETVQDFREVVITSRTQYFPGQEDKPYKLQISRYDDEGFHTLVKLYLSPFDDKEIRCYLNKKFGVLRFWNRGKKQKARRIVSNSPKLMVRPMLLSYIDYLVDGNQHYSTTYEIYEALIKKWIEREGDKREHLYLNREKLKKNLHKYSQLVAVKIYEKRKEANSLQLSKADATDVNVELEDYQMTGQSLLTRDAENNWKFAHKSILEFFLAKEASEKIDFAMTFDFSGMDMVLQFCIENKTVLYPDFVCVNGGLFLMGSPDKEPEREQIETQHPVKISNFYLCKYVVTVAQFKEFIEASAYQTDAEKANSSIILDGNEWKEKAGINWRHGALGNEWKAFEYNHPVLHVSWNDAVTYCKWISKKSGKLFRLPTEAEWEYACRAGAATPFTTGDNLTTEQANYDGNYSYNKNNKGIYRKNTVAVDSFQPNAFGLYNMHGNVWEWCSDWYGDNYYMECNAKGTVENPRGPETGSHRVLRGGCWRGDAGACRSANRNCYPPGGRRSGVGFRLVFVP